MRLSSPVYTNTSYRNPPKTQPQKGETIGICKPKLAALPASSKSPATYPEIIPPRREHLSPIPHGITHQPRPKISRHIHRIPRLPTKARSEPKNQKEQPQRKQLPCSDIALVLEREDHKHEQCAGDELGEKHVRPRQEGLRVRAEDAGRGGLGRRHGADAVPLDVVDARNVVGVHDARAAEAAQELRQEEDGEALPRELAQEAVREGDGGVEVAA